MQEYLNNSKPIEEMTLCELMEYRRIHDRKVILEASMRRSQVEVKRLPNKRDHPFDPKYVGRHQKRIIK